MSQRDFAIWVSVILLYGPRLFVIWSSEILLHGPARFCSLDLEILLYGPRDFAIRASRFCYHVPICCYMGFEILLSWASEILLYGPAKFTLMSQREFAIWASEILL